MKENGIKLRIKNMEEAGKYGRTAVFMKDGGNLVKLMEGVDSLIKKVTSIPVIGVMIKLMGTENSLKMTVQITRANGLKMRNTVKA